MWYEGFQIVFTILTAISVVIGIAGVFHTARHDRPFLALLCGLAACAAVGYMGYLMGNMDGNRLRASNARKDQRIAQLEAQLASGRTPTGGPAGTDGAGNSPPSHAGSGPASAAGEKPMSLATLAPAGQACPLNDSWDCAEQLALGQRDSDKFQAKDEERYYYVDVAQPGVLSVTLDPVPKSMGLDLSIHDSDRRPLGATRLYAERPGNLTARVRAAGRYFLKLKLFYCCVSTPEPYTIIAHGP